MVKIFVDADACPVKKEVERIALRYNLETFLVCNGGIRPSMNHLIKNIFVNQGEDAADDWIVDNIELANICVTNDIPLAGRCLKRGAFVIKPNGDTYNSDNIGIALATRKIMEQKREKGEFTRGPSPFTKADRSKFLNKMEIIIQKARKF